MSKDLVINADMFSWKYTTRSSPLWPSFYSGGSRITFQLSYFEPVVFDGRIKIVRNWLDKKHKNGAMHEPLFSFVLAQLISIIQPKVYFDIGAFIGYFTLFALPLLPLDTQVFAFEMNPSSCRIAYNNVLLNGHLATSRIYVLNAGIAGAVELSKPVVIDKFRLMSATTSTKSDRIDILTLDYLFGHVGRLT